MEIIVKVPAERLEFALEVLRSLAFVESARPKTRSARASAAAKAAALKLGPEQDTTDYLLASPANAAQLKRSMEQLRRGEGIRVAFNDKGNLEPVK